MATLFSITTRRRDGMKPRAPLEEPAAAMPPTTIHSRELVARTDRTSGLAALTAQYYRLWQPTVIEERLLVDLLIAADWQLRRLQAGRRLLPPEPA